MLPSLVTHAPEIMISRRSTTCIFLMLPLVSSLVITIIIIMGSAAGSSPRDLIEGGHVMLFTMDDVPQQLRVRAFINSI